MNYVEPLIWIGPSSRAIVQLSQMENVMRSSRRAFNAVHSPVFFCRSENSSADPRCPESVCNPRKQPALLPFNHPRGNPVVTGTSFRLLSRGARTAIHNEIIRESDH
jgi:hypothetical protein